MDTHLPHVRAEYAEIRPSLDCIVLQARTLVASLRDIPRPLYAYERKVADRARVRFAEHLRDGLQDLIGDLRGPMVTRADDCGFELPETDLTDLLREIESLERECSATCVTARAA
jgi:hypothetical protein